MIKNFLIDIDRLLQLNLNYPDLLGLDNIVQIIEGLDNRKYGY